MRLLSRGFLLAVALAAPVAAGCGGSTAPTPAKMTDDKMKGDGMMKDDKMMSPATKK